MSEHSFTTVEAKKYSYRQSKDGFILSFVIQPHDMKDGLALAAIGTRVLLAVAEIADEVPTDAPRSGGEQNVAPAAVDTSSKSDRAREAYREMGEPERIVAKCAMLCAEPKFRLWLHNGSFDGGFFDNAEEAAAEVRRRCHIKSRSELASNPHAASIWQKMQTDYDIWRGALPEIRA